jgi:hypothetical protein
LDEKDDKERRVYWYRDEDRSTVLHVFDPLGNGIWKAWDWNRGRLMLCQIADYPGEWFGLLAVPK